MKHKSHKRRGGSSASPLLFPVIVFPITLACIIVLCISVMSVVTQAFGETKCSTDPLVRVCNKEGDVVGYWSLKCYTDCHGIDHLTLDESKPHKIP